MSAKVPEIILCKGVSQESGSQNSYESVLENAGYTCQVLPTLCFEFVNLDKLKECIRNCHKYSGLIFTSQRSIEAIDLVKKKESISLKDWIHLPTYCIGPATATLAQERLGLQKILGKESGNAENLANFIVENAVPALPLLYPCSIIARETIDKILVAKNIQFQKLVVYKTMPSKTLQTDFENILESSIKYFVLFSPSIVDFVLPLLHKRNDLLKNIKLIAIGQVTNEAINKLGEKAAAVLSKPEPPALLNAIKSCT